MQLNDVVAAARGTTAHRPCGESAELPQLARNSLCPCSITRSRPPRPATPRILLPATIYNFGEDAPQILVESSPQNPRSRKGQVRVEMELKLQEASLYGVRSIIVRAGDFFGPGAGTSWLTRGMISSSPLLRSVFYPGPSNTGHSWAYLPDLAETMVRLIECEPPMGAYQVFHFRGHWFERGRGTGRTRLPHAWSESEAIKPFPWWLIKLASPFVGVFHEMLEMAICGRCRCN